MQTLYNQCANFVQTVCLHRHTQTKTLPFALLELLSQLKKLVYCTSITKSVSVQLYTSVYITSSLYKFTQNQFTVQVYTKPIYCTCLHKTSSLNKFTQNQFTIQVYTKPVYCTSVHKTSSLCKCTQNKFTVQVYTKPVYWLIMKGMYCDWS